MNGKVWHRWFKKTSDLSTSEIEELRSTLKGKQPFSMYFNAAIEDLERGVDNRWFHRNSRQGIAMAIEFDGISVFSLIGDVDDALIGDIASDPGKCEFHVMTPQAQHIESAAGARICRRSDLRYYLLELEKSSRFPLNSHDLRMLTPEDFSIVQLFYSNYYTQTIFSSWMLERPFVGLFVDNQLVSSGGTIVLDQSDRAANIGNFLTAPQHRGQGHSKIVLKFLINKLLEQGISTFSLGTTADNVAACRVYEAVGFSLLASRVELEMKPLE